MKVFDHWQRWCHFSRSDIACGSNDLRAELNTGVMALWRTVGDCESCSVALQPLPYLKDQTMTIGNYAGASVSCNLCGKLGPLLRYDPNRWNNAQHQDY